MANTRKNKNSVEKAPKAAVFYRPTAMSIAMAAAGIIPGTHLIRDFRNTALVRHHHDRANIQPSTQVAF